MINSLTTKGFVLPFTMLISVLILFITTSVMTLLSKQMYFSKLYKQSQSAYYAADDAMACALAIDDTYISADGLGIFPSGTTTNASTYIDDTITFINSKRHGVNPMADVITRTGAKGIKCGQSPIFDPAISSFTISQTNYVYRSLLNGNEEGKTVSFKMHMDLGGGDSRCAKVTINKTQSFRQIISQGYSTCDNPSTAVERAVVNTTIAE